MSYNYILYRLRELKKSQDVYRYKVSGFVAGKGDPFQVPKWVLVEHSEMTRADKVRDFIG